MTDEEIRTKIVEAMREGLVEGFDEGDRADTFIAGSRDVRLDELEFDSLGIAEACIAIEEQTNVTVEPDEIGDMTNLSELVALIRKRLK